jgi:hypothetical protein
MEKTILDPPDTLTCHSECFHFLFLFVMKEPKYDCFMLCMRVRISHWLFCLIYLRQAKVGKVWDTSEKYYI